MKVDKQILCVKRAYSLVGKRKIGIKTEWDNRAEETDREMEPVFAVSWKVSEKNMGD